jgi:heme A synthase
MQTTKAFRLSVVTNFLIITTMAVGSYVGKVGAGTACPDWPLCPLETDYFIVLEFAHRIIAFITFLAGLASFIYSRRTGIALVKKISLSAFAALLVQVFMVGALVIFTETAALIVAAHQAAAATVASLYAANTATLSLYAAISKNRGAEAVLT